MRFLLSIYRNTYNLLREGVLSRLRMDDSTIIQMVGKREGTFAGHTAGPDLISTITQ